MAADNSELEASVAPDNRRHSRHSRRRVLLVGLIGLVVVLVLAGIFLWNMPLGPRLVALGSTPTPLATPTVEPTATTGAEAAADVAPSPEIQATASPTAPPTPEPTPQPLCGGPAIMYLMIVGKDGPPRNYAAGFADSIRIARLDFVTPSVSLLAVPRDMIVSIPGLAQHRIIDGRVNSAYAYGFQYRVDGGGPSLLAQTLTQNFNIQIDHYVIASYGVIEDGINAIGGVEVEIPESIAEDVPMFSPGFQTLDGAQVVEYARIRDETSDPRDTLRVQRQTDLLLAIRDKIMSPSVLPEVPALARSLAENVLTDLTPSEISTLVCIGPKIDLEDIDLVYFDDSMYEYQIDAYGEEILTPRYKVIEPFIEDFKKGETAD
jgi:LCP family protein required for cell wall assembly